MYFRDPYTILIFTLAIVTVAVILRIVLGAVRRNPWTLGRPLVGTWVGLAVLVLGMTAWIYSKHGFGVKDIGKAPDFSVTTVDGHTLTSKNLQGKVVLLEFWATYCGPCVATMPSIESLKRKFQGPSFVLVGVSVDEDQEVWRAFIAKNKMDWPQYLDRSRELAKAFQVQGPPAYIVIGTNGEIRFRQLGWVPTTTFQLDREIGEALQATK